MISKKASWLSRISKRLNLFEGQEAAALHQVHVELTFYSRRKDLNMIDELGPSKFSKF